MVDQARVHRSCSVPSTYAVCCLISTGAILPSFIALEILCAVFLVTQTSDFWKTDLDSERSQPQFICVSQQAHAFYLAGFQPD